MLTFVESFNLPSGRVFVWETKDGYKIESTEMRDVAVDGKLHSSVREASDPRIIWKHLVPKKDKWLMTVSTQKGCAHNCKFCDVAPLPFKGNLTYNEIIEQIEHMLYLEPHLLYGKDESFKKIKIGFARMGEPSHNIKNVLDAIKTLPDLSILSRRHKLNWLPCFNSILPKKTMDGYSAEDIIKNVIDTKENYYDGFLHFQISCNSTDEDIRKKLFGGADVLPIEDVVRIINKENIHNRTVTLNFIVMKGVPVDVQYLKKLGLNKDKFVVKLIPLNITDNSIDNELETFANYHNYEDLVKLANEFKEIGVPVVYDAIARCEEAGLCCGQILRNFYSK